MRMICNMKKAKGIFCEGLVCMLLLLLCTTIHAQSGSVIKGTVYDAATRLPLSGANIQGKKIRSITSENGSFSFHTMLNEVTIRVSYVGYESRTVAVDVQHGEPVMILLNRLSDNLDEVEVLPQHLYFGAKNMQVID